MGFEWSMKSKNKPLANMLPFVQKCLLDEGIENFIVDAKSVTVPPSDDDADWGMTFIVEDDHLYYLNRDCYRGGERIMERIRQMLVESGFDATFEEL